MPIQWFIDTLTAIFYIIVYRYVYVSAIYGKNHIIFPVLKIFFSFFEKSRSFHPWLHWGDRQIDRLSSKNLSYPTFNLRKYKISSVCQVSLDFPQRLNFLKFLLKWDYISLMKWNFFKRENPDCLQICGDWQASWTWYRLFCCSVASFIVVVIGFCCAIEHIACNMFYVLCFKF